MSYESLQCLVVMLYCLSGTRYRTQDPTEGGGRQRDLCIKIKTEIVRERAGK